MRYFLILMIVSSFACKSNKATTELNKGISFEMETTPCFGACPVYIIKIEGNGKATYTGKDHTTKKGVFTKQFSNDEITKLMNEFDAAAFFDKADNYPTNITDAPIIHLTYTKNGKTKKITDHFDAPKEIKALQKLMGSYANSEGWTEQKTN